MALKHGMQGILQVRTVLQRAWSLVQTPAFWLLSFWGNAFILIGAGILQHFESSVNPAAESFLDCYVWAVSLVTTVGVGNIHPVTTGGKILLVVMMMGGAVFLWSYMALFIGALVDPELKSIEHDVSKLKSGKRK